MSYQVLARKYRSQSFDQLIGQGHISQTLINAFKNNRIPHAMLFTGLRGTGKTSTARILAKTLRCLNLQNFTPCNTCESCKSINDGSSVDVLEIDGASNNGVDAIRDLRESVMFMPTSGQYKIIIIDEVHMLSTSAFNALLKTLEEPPAHVIFMMATTEVHKIPQTILSRCQRFDLRRISVKHLTQHLKNICEKENISAEDKALWLIAKQGDGSARDSLSLLDQVINFSSGQLTEKVVSEILGLTDRQLLLQVFSHLLSRNTSAILQELEKAHQVGLNPSLFLEELLQILRNVILLKSADSADVLIDLPLEEIETLKQLTKSHSLPDLHMLFDMCLKSLNDISRASDPFLVFEVVLLRMAQAPHIVDIFKLTTSAGASTLPKSHGVDSTPSPEKQISPVSPGAVTHKPIEPVEPEKPKPIPQPETWLHFIHFLQKQNAFMAAQLDNVIFAGFKEASNPISNTASAHNSALTSASFSTQSSAHHSSLTNNLVTKRGQIILEVTPQFNFLADQLNQQETQQKLQGFIDSFFGKGYTLTVVKAKVASGDSAVSLNQKKEKESEEKLRQQLMQDSRVQMAQKVFQAQFKIITKE